MCREDKGIAANHSHYKGRIKNVRMNNDNQLVADFYERTSTVPNVVIVSELKFPNNKAKKAINEIKEKFARKTVRYSAEVAMN